MRTIMTLFLAGILTLAIVGGCNGTDQQASHTDTAGKKPAAASPAPARPGQSPTRQARVLETMNGGGYTYVQVDIGDGPAWYAGPPTQVAVGDTVDLPTNGMPMRNFESKALGRNFEVLYLVNTIGKAGGTDAAAAVARAHGTVPAATTDVDLTGISKPDGGLTVAEVLQAGKSAQGREIVVRGKVVKYNAGIMGKNWVHVRDGTGAEGMNDLTVTTLDAAEVGDTVLVTGRISVDRDFGYGYKYDLLIEDAKVVVE